MSSTTSSSTSPNRIEIPTVSTYLVWSLFAGSLVGTAVTTWVGFEFGTGTLVRIDGLTKVMWIAVTFFSGIVQSFSLRYMAANENRDRFFGYTLLFTLTVLVMTAANNVVLFVSAWAGMGLIMAELIGHVEKWPQARAAGALSRRYFLIGSVLVAVGLGLLTFQTGATTITGILAEVGTLWSPLRVVAAVLLVAAALVQSALFPFHRWLLSSMTAPTPASALMHAGFVNAGGLLLSRLAPVVATEEWVMLAAVIVGGIGSLLAQAAMLVQSDYKGRLGCSTIAQMGFMILQCGLGFFAAAVTHLIVHGFYKAYLFLSTGSKVTKKAPGSKQGGSSKLVSVGALATAIAGGVLFAVLSGKSLDPSETGILLVVIVAVAVFQAASELLENRSLPRSVRVIGLPVIVLPAFAAYALVYNAVSTLMHAMPMVHAPMEMTPLHWSIVGLFVLGHLSIRAGWLQNSERVYVALLNVSRPDPRTIPTHQGEYES